METATCREVYPGEIFNTWCSKHGDRGTSTDHLWTGHGLVCLICNPGSDPRTTPPPPPGPDAPKQ